MTFIMAYLPLSQHPKAWVFQHQNLPINEDDFAKIKPMDTLRATTFWNTFVSKQVDHPDFFKKGDWPFSPNTWQDQGNWETQWDGDNAALPESILAHLNWPSNTVVYFCNDRKQIIETTWDVFQRCWKNFLFMDDGPLLMGKKRDKVVQFMSNGTYRIGDKSNIG